MSRAILLLLIAALVAACGIVPSPAPSATPPPAATLVPPTPGPLCVFGGAAPATPAAAATGAFKFAEPQVVYDSNSDLVPVEWLPDGKTLLVTRAITQTAGEYVEVFNTETRAIQVHGLRHRTDVPFGPRPVWWTKHNTPLFTEASGGQIALNMGKPVGAGLVGGLASPYISATADGVHVAYLPGTPPGQPAETAEMHEETLMPFTLPLVAPADLAATEAITQVEPYRPAFSPDGARVTFASNIGLYLGDTQGRLCRVDLGVDGSRHRWALDARWSPDGRTLALFVTVGRPVVPYIQVALLDTATGALRPVDTGHQYAYALAWSPDSRALLIASDLGQEGNTRRYGLFLADRASAQSRRLFPERATIDGVYLGLAWSAVSNRVAFACPEMGADGNVAAGRICVSQVTP